MESAVALATEKWTILPAPALAAASNSAVEFSTAWSKAVAFRPNRVQYVL